jgi:transposase-like protein
MTLVDQLEQQLLARLEELAPAVAEYRETEVALAALRRARDATASAGDAPEGAVAPSRRRAVAGPTRSEQALELIARRPGVTVPEIAEELGIGPTYLYKLLPALERQQRVRKQGTGYQPVVPALPARRAEDRRRTDDGTRTGATGTRASNGDGDPSASPGSQSVGPDTARSPSRRKRRSSSD